MNDQQIEQEIQAKGANVAPRITPADIEANIWPLMGYELRSKLAKES